MCNKIVHSHKIGLLGCVGAFRCVCLPRKRAVTTMSTKNQRVPDMHAAPLTFVALSIEGYGLLLDWLCSTSSCRPFIFGTRFARVFSFSSSIQKKYAARPVRRRRQESGAVVLERRTGRPASWRRRPAQGSVRRCSCSPSDPCATFRRCPCVVLRVAVIE